MSGSSKLIPSHIKAWCDKSIKALEEDNKRLLESMLSLEGFEIIDTTDTNASNIIKEQISNIYSAIKYFKVANDLDIQDFITLQNIVGDEELDDNKLLVALELAKLELEKSMMLATKYKTVVNNLSSEYVVYSNSYEIESTYDELVEVNKKIVKKIQTKLELYYEINRKACKLFKNGEALRQLGTIVINEIIKSSYVGGVFSYINNKDLQQKTMSMLSNSQLEAYNSVLRQDVNNDERVICDDYSDNYKMIDLDSIFDVYNMLEYETKYESMLEKPVDNVSISYMQDVMEADMSLYNYTSSFISE